MARRRLLPITRRPYPLSGPFASYDAWQLVMRGRNNKTAATYSTGVIAFADWLQWSSKSIFPLSLSWPLDEKILTVEMVLQFRIYLVETKTPGSVRTYINGLLSFFKYLHVHELMPPAIDLNDLKVKLQYYGAGRARNYQSGEKVARLDPYRQELPRMIDYYCGLPLTDKRYNRHMLTLRNRAIVSFLIETAVRVSEATMIDRVAIELGPEKYNWEPVIAGKGGKFRSIFIKDARTRALMIDYLNGRAKFFAELEIENCVSLFPSFSRGYLGQRMTRAGIHNVVKTAVHALGLYPELSAHDCRHYQIVHLLRLGFPLDLVSIIAGHEDIATTKNIYAAVRRTNEISDQLDKIKR